MPPAVSIFQKQVDEKQVLYFIWPNSGIIIAPLNILVANIIQNVHLFIFIHHERCMFINRTVSPFPSLNYSRYA